MWKTSRISELIHMRSFRQWLLSQGFTAGIAGHLLGRIDAEVRVSQSTSDSLDGFNNRRVVA